MAAWVGHHTPKDSHIEYKKKFGCDPHIYSWDLKGYGTLQFPEKNVFSLVGFSEKVFDLMQILKEDKKTLINEIKSISF